MALSISIVVDITAEAAGSPGVARTFAYTKLSGAPTVTLSLSDLTGVTSFNWTFVSKPVGSSAALSSATVASPTFTPDVEGTYLVQCTVNSGEAYAKNAIAFTTERLALRKPAAGETTEFSSDSGWREALNELFDVADTGIKVYSQVAASAAVVSDAATDFDKDYTIPANTLVEGSVIKIRAQGIITSVAAGGAVTIAYKIGSTVIRSDGFTPVGNDIFSADIELIVRTVGAGGTIIGSTIGGETVSGVTVSQLASTAIDTTATQKIAVSCDFVNAGNSARLDGLTVALI